MVPRGAPTVNWCDHCEKTWPRNEVTSDDGGKTTVSDDEFQEREILVYEDSKFDKKTYLALRRKDLTYGLERFRW